MDRILQNIRSVHGVIGVIVIDKSRALTYQLMPASYSADEVKAIALPLLHLGKSITTVASIDFFYESGVARAYNKDDQITVIIGRQDLNLNALGVVCREAIPAISRKFASGQLGVSVAPKTGQPDGGIEFLLKAINIIAANCLDKVGNYLVTRNLRRAKDELAAQYPVLTHISIDNNGVASLIKGITPQIGEADMKAFAHMANLFLSFCAKTSDKLKPDDIINLTFEIKDKLDLAGFYHVYADTQLKS